MIADAPPVSGTELQTTARIFACPLCDSPRTTLMLEKLADGKSTRDYRDCPECRLVFVPPEFHPSRRQEKSRYDHHRNNPEDDRYVSFLERLAVPLSERLDPESHGLDFGCGPRPVMAMILRRLGHRMDSFDPYYGPGCPDPEKRYDFLSCSEVVEHFRRPAEEFRRMDRLVRPGGTLGIMTRILTPDIDFASWWYHRDETHLCFYRTDTFEWIGRRHHWKVEFPVENVMILHKQV